MRPYREKIVPDAGSSLCRLHRRLEDGIPFQWHHHPEYELTLTLNSRGQRFIGDHVGEYGDADLVLLGPNLPHTWVSREKVAAEHPHRALVVWFRREWAEELVSHCAELSSIGALLQRSGRGVFFPSAAAGPMVERFESMFESAPACRLASLLSLLDDLSHSGAEQLSSRSPQLEQTADGRDRIDRVLTAIHAGYTGDLSLSGLAQIACLSESGLHRLFVKHTGKTVSSYIAHMRIGDACARLGGSSESIAFIADAVGYHSVSNFNRQFRAIRAMTPRDYRRHFQAAGAAARRAA